MPSGQTTLIAFYLSLILHLFYINTKQLIGTVAYPFAAGFIIVGGASWTLFYLGTNLVPPLLSSSFSFSFIIPLFFFFLFIFINGGMRIMTIATFQRCYLWSLSKHKPAIFWRKALWGSITKGVQTSNFKLQRFKRECLGCGWRPCMTYVGSFLAWLSYLVKQ